MQPMKRLKISLLYDKVYYIAIGVLLVSLFSYIWFLIPLYLFYIRKRKYFKIVFIVMLLFGGRYLLKINKSFKIDTVISGEVIEVKEKSYLVKLKNQRVILYSDIPLEMGNKVKAKGTYREIDYASVPIDYEKYYLRHDTKYQFFANEIEVKQGYSIFYFRNKLLKYFDTFDKRIGPYYKSLLLGYNNDLAIKENLSIIGISHMFAISGLHILLFVKILEKFLKRRYINVFLILYLGLTGFSPSVMRASLIVLLGNFFKWKKYDFSSLDTFSFVFLFLLFINPNYIYDIGFELSFLISFSLLVTEFKPKHQVLQVSTLSQIMSLPIVVNINNQINLLAILYNLILIGFFTSIFLPFTLYSSFIKNFKPYEWLVYIFEKVIIFLSKIQFCIIKIPSFSTDTFILYYVATFILFTTKKALYLAIILLFVFFRTTLSISQNVFVFDVGQGDSILIKTRTGNMMIDCYNDSYRFLIKKGIRHLDYLVLTHGHDDHVRDAILISKEIKVHTLIVSYYDNSPLIQEIIPYYNNVLFLKANDSFYLGKTKFNVLAPNKKDDNYNNNSLVLKAKLGEKTFLFMGDYENEETLIGNDIKADVLKIGHHGSENANNRKFIDEVNPKEAIISVARYNKYNLPSKYLIMYLEKKKIKVHITYQENTYKYSFT